MLFHAALLFGFLALVTTAGSMFPRVIRARIWYGLPFGVVLLALGTAPAIVLSHAEQLDVDLTATVVVVAILALMGRRKLMIKAPEKTVATLKGDIEWAKGQIRSNGR